MGDITVRFKVISDTFGSTSFSTYVINQANDTIAWNYANYLGNFQGVNLLVRYVKYLDVKACFAKMQEDTSPLPSLSTIQSKAQELLSIINTDIDIKNENYIVDVWTKDTYPSQSNDTNLLFRITKKIGIIYGACACGTP